MLAYRLACEDFDETLYDYLLALAVVVTGDFRYTTTNKQRPASPSVARLLISLGASPDGRLGDCTVWSEYIGILLSNGLRLFERYEDA